MPRSWRRWACAGRCQLAGISGAAVALVLVLHCINIYKDGCSASEARQAVGGGRGAVVRGANLAEAIHRLALWVGGLSTAGGVRTLRPGISAHAGSGAGLQLPRPEQSPEKYG